MSKIKANILVVDDDGAVLSSAKLFLKQKFTFVQTLEDPAALDSVLKEVDFDLVLLDMNYAPGENEGAEGLRLIEQLIRDHPKVEVLPITAYGEIDLAVEALRRGARDFVTKPWQNEKLLITMSNLLQLRMASREINQLKSATKELEHVGDEPLVGHSRAFLRVLEMVEKVAPTDANVLILGENGTGKDILARRIHQLSGRNSHRFVKIDLGSLASNLFESELFGHVKGAFTDAQEDRMGKMVLANEGTLFLDEIGNLDPPQQAAMLSALEQRQVVPVGSNQPIQLDIRLISATNADLDQQIQQGQFRQDLLYRINTIEITMPPLRERAEDIPDLANHFLNQYKKSYNKTNLKWVKESLTALQAYPWPGNIRELAHVIERAVILTDGPTILPNSLVLTPDETKTSDNLNLQDMEKALILKALEKNKGNVTRAARDLGIDRLALYRRLEKYGL